jgi:hypothetical protein
MHQWRLRRSALQHAEVLVNGSNGPFATFYEKGLRTLSYQVLNNLRKAMRDEVTCGNFNLQVVYILIYLTMS